MGTLGIGNFDNDHSWNYFFTIEETLLKDIIFRLAPHQHARFRGHGALEIMAAIDILLKLHEHYGITLLISTKDIREWRDTFLTLYDSQGEWEHNKPLFPSDPNHQIKRRAVIIETFKKLEAIVYYQDKP